MMEFRDVRERTLVRDEFILVLCSGRFAEQTSSAKYLAYPVLLISLAPSALADACVPMSRCEDPIVFWGRALLALSGLREATAFVVPALAGFPPKGGITNLLLQA